jgi:hypothetical protein
VEAETVQKQKRTRPKMGTRVVDEKANKDYIKYKNKFKIETIGHIQGHCDPLMVFKLIRSQAL